MTDPTKPRAPSPVADDRDRAARRSRSTAAELRRRFPRLLLGLVLCALGIAMMVAAGLGLGPWDVLHEGLSNLAGFPIGRTTIVVGAGVLLLWIPLRERPGLGTVLNVAVIGLVIDLTLTVLPTPESFWPRLAMMMSGLALSVSYTHLTLPTIYSV